MVQVHWPGLPPLGRWLGGHCWPLLLWISCTDSEFLLLPSPIPLCSRSFVITVILLCFRVAHALRNPDSAKRILSPVAMLPRSRLKYCTCHCSKPFTPLLLLMEKTNSTLVCEPGCLPVSSSPVFLLTSQIRPLVFPSSFSCIMAFALFLTTWTAFPLDCFSTRLWHAYLLLILWDSTKTPSPTRMHRFPCILNVPVYHSTQFICLVALTKATTVSADWFTVRLHSAGMSVLEGWAQVSDPTVSRSLALSQRQGRRSLWTSVKCGRAPTMHLSAAVPPVPRLSGYSTICLLHFFFQLILFPKFLDPVVQSF